MRPIWTEREPAALSLSTSPEPVELPLLPPVEEEWEEEVVFDEPEAVGPAGEVPLFPTGYIGAGADTIEVATDEACTTALEIAVSAGAAASVTEVLIAEVTTLSTAEETALATEATEATAVVDSSAGASSPLAKDLWSLVMKTKLTGSDGLLLGVIGGLRSGDLVELVGAVNASGEGRCSEGKDEGRGAHDDELCWLLVLN
jgi:hypothetical protein